MWKAILPCALALLTTFGCTNKDVIEYKDIKIDLTDPVTQQIYNAQNQRKAVSVVPFLSVDNPSHRYTAALALGAIQDTATIKDLASLLEDPNPQIRKAAVLALGRTRHVKAAEYLAKAFQTDTVRNVQAAILEAVGKCGDETYLKYICVNRPYPVKDSALLYGQAMALFHFAHRGMTHQEGTVKIMNDYIANALVAPNARFAAANYLAIARKIDLKGYQNILNKKVLEEEDNRILAALVLGLAKTGANEAYKTLDKVLKKTTDYRIKCNIIKGLRYFEYDSVKTTAFYALKDKNLQVKMAAANFFYSSGSPTDATLYEQNGYTHANWEVRGLLLGAALRNAAYFRTQTKNFYSQKINRKLAETDNLYERASLIRALGNYAWNYRTVERLIFPAADTIKIPSVIRSAGAEAIVAMRHNPNFSKELGISKIRVQNELARILKRCVEEGDPAMMAIAAEEIGNPKFDFKRYYSDTNFLTEAQKRLSLPGSIETYQMLQNTLDKVNNTTTPRIKSLAITEIDWPLIRGLIQNPKLLVKTSKGDFSMELKPEAAPATVTQFVHLVKAGYYDNRAFHRLVPNFVLQGGCSRGDGWSGFDVTVRTEVSTLEYNKAGCVGMASAGKDTESAQFFITYGPEMRLNEDYTIFAQITSGMNIVEQLSIGDKIKSIELY
jgi:cyclophilin family peptidyl-prolyl cis-trans isomerase